MTRSLDNRLAKLEEEIIPKLSERDRIIFVWDSETEEEAFQRIGIDRIPGVDYIIIRGDSKTDPYA